MTFKKLDDLPKGRPATYDEVMKAMAELHKGVLKQAAMYGGKNSKLYIPHVVETSLMKAVSNQDLVDNDLDALLESAENACFELTEHLKSNDDTRGAELLNTLLRRMNAATTSS